MHRKNIAPSIWRTARVETATLAILVLASATASNLGWMPSINASLAALAIYALWLAVCVVVYRFFYRLDT
jgi:hypothetical protein